MIPKAKSFHFEGYKFDVRNKNIIFDYKIEFYNQDSLLFQEKIILPKDPGEYDTGMIERVLQSLELILGISYYKLYCPGKIVTSFDLSKEQADFWDVVYRNGLGEFLYRNKLDFDRVAKFPHTNKKEVVKDRPLQSLLVSSSQESEQKILLGFGGGKESLVASGLLQEMPDKKVTSFLLETQKADPVARSVAEKVGNPILTIRRELDTKLFKSHECSYNGHIPISAIIAFTGVLTAALYGYKYVAVGNEFSSNFGNVEHCGQEINHQWSKSIEFEILFQEYARKFITPEIQYFSLLRPFHEVRIAKMFAKYGKKYFKVFTSCNRNFRIFKDRPESLWCGECPKCAFVFLMLAPFIKKKELIDIFGKNLLADEKLLPLFRDLLGFGEVKPFDCVGTFEEAGVALYLASKKYKDDIIIKSFGDKLKIDEDAIERVFQTNPVVTLPTEFQFLGIKNVGILGYGREGKITEKYLKKNYPNLKIGILDKSLDKDYLAKQGEYDLIIKTPGISKQQIIRPYTTATNIFFANNKNLKIGVTGTKGKSTTASLIYEIIKASGKKVRLLGNIGRPMLEILLEEKTDPEEIFILEFSSYMLDDIKYSPNIAVLLNVFPEHKNYHGSLEKYYEAKRNIFKFQKEGDVGIKFPFKKYFEVTEGSTLLKGAHNLKNIRAAIQVAKILKIDDKIIKKIISKFKPLDHRLEFVGEFRNIKFYDDANATTPEATMAALKTLPEIETIFLGGEDRGYDFNEMEQAIKKSEIKNIVLFPDTGDRMLKSQLGFNVLQTKNMEEAIKFAYRVTSKGKGCLLSMASPSYSLWKNFEEKGDLFQRLVKKLGE